MTSAGTCRRRGNDNRNWSACGALDRGRGAPESRNEINEALRENDDDMAAGIVRNAEVNNDKRRRMGRAVTHPEPTAVRVSNFGH